MALVKCPECQTEISDQALSCPKCGYVQRQPIVKHEQITNMAAVGVVVGMVVILIVALLVSAGTGSDWGGVITAIVGTILLFAMTTMRK